MNAFDLATRLGATLSGVLPPVIVVRVVGSELVIKSATGYAAGGRVTFDVAQALWLHADHGDGRQVERAALDLLDVVQDVAAEATSEPWPGRSVMPTPRAVVTDGRLQLSYVYENGEVALDLEPIALAAEGVATE